MASDNRINCSGTNERRVEKQTRLYVGRLIKRRCSAVPDVVRVQPSTTASTDNEAGMKSVCESAVRVDVFVRGQRPSIPKTNSVRFFVSLVRNPFHSRFLETCEAVNPPSLCSWTRRRCGVHSSPWLGFVSQVVVVKS